MKKLSALLAALLLLVSASPALAQEGMPELRIRLTRDFGYGGFDNRIEGRFSMRAGDADGFVRVDFYIDDELIGSRVEAPFNLQFHTENFDEGARTMYAIGVTSDGTEVRSNEYTRVFISGAEVGDSVRGMLIPLLGIVALATAISVFLPRLIWGRKGYKLGDYGALGGAVCKRCAKPFKRHVWAPNMVTGKLERCPHCGKWQIARRATPPELEAAEALLKAEAGEGGGAAKTESEEDKLRRQIDESRFN